MVTVCTKLSDKLKWRYEPALVASHCRGSTEQQASKARRLTHSCFEGKVISQQLYPDGHHAPLLLSGKLNENNLPKKSSWGSGENVCSVLTFNSRLHCKSELHALCGGEAFTQRAKGHTNKSFRNRLCQLERWLKQTVPTTQHEGMSLEI